ncbi:hypothetical protein [Actinomadura rupiterrae]|uniref:hypothetical protein n=1 Tax=Actinomadura rupiterrae TaxID=559627 RepID=UPI0020A52C29|nr:hypothetical protein [Actinomadura rupiterrae]MCP2341023.1 ribosomal protein S27E [Actinomadura rupiterrae]
MIHKSFRRNGRPNYRRWIMECDGCGLRHKMLSASSSEWFIPRSPGFRVYCPDCYFVHAASLIIWAVRCRGCNGDDIDFWYDDDPTDPHLYIACGECGATLWSFTDEITLSGLIDGWDLPPAEGWRL